MTTPTPTPTQPEAAARLWAITGPCRQEPPTTAYLAAGWSFHDLNRCLDELCSEHGNDYPFLAHPSMRGWFAPVLRNLAAAGFSWDYDPEKARTSLDSMTRHLRVFLDGKHSLAWDGPRETTQSIEALLDAAKHDISRPHAVDVFIRLAAGLLKSERLRHGPKGNRRSNEDPDEKEAILLVLRNAPPVIVSHLEATVSSAAAWNIDDVSASILLRASRAKKRTQSQRHDHGDDGDDDDGTREHSQKRQRGPSPSLPSTSTLRHGRGGGKQRP